MSVPGFVDKVRAPFTPAQQQALYDWQNNSKVHPFTCVDGHGALLVGRHWYCHECDYTQYWAHGFMAGEELAPPEIDAPVRSIVAAEDVCRAAGLHADGEYGPWLSSDERIGVGIARLGVMYLGAGVSWALDREAGQEQQIAKIEPGAPASLLRVAIECAQRLSEEARR